MKLVATHDFEQSLPDALAWQQFSIRFWSCMLLPFIAYPVSDRFLAALPTLLVQICVAIAVVIAVTLLLSSCAYGIAKRRRDTIIYTILGLLPLILGLLSMSPELNGLLAAFSAPLSVRLPWISWLLPAAAIYLVAYALLFNAHAKAAAVDQARPALVPALLGVLAIAVTIGVCLHLPLASDSTIKSYFARQTGVASYQIENTVWSHTCCAESVLTTPRKANGVRYVAKITFKDGRKEEETLDLYDTRSEVEQMDDFDMGSGGHQKWQVGSVYGPGQVPPSVVWSV